MTDGRKPLGDRCEALAADYLTARGYQVRHRKYRTRMGEVDLICEDGATVVFVEVKARSGSRFGHGSEAVDWRKQQRLMRIAEMYMAKVGDRPCRFDVVAVTLQGATARIEHMPNAFP
jgi:putative endonuclease